MNKTDHLIGVVGYLESECEDCLIKLSSLRAEIARVEGELVGKREKLRHAKESLRQYRASLPNREVTLREFGIARMLGIHLKVGSPISDEQWTSICALRSS